MRKHFSNALKQNALKKSYLLNLNYYAFIQSTLYSTLGFFCFVYFFCLFFLLYIPKATKLKIENGKNQIKVNKVAFQ